MKADVEMKNVAFETLLACPYAETENTKQQNSVKILTKQYFEKGNEEKLLNALDITIPSSQNTISTATLETYQKCVCRYLGMHSQVKLKTKAQSFLKVEKKMNLVIEANETMMEATASQDDGDNDSEIMFAQNDKVSKSISSDILMRGIKSAKRDKNYRKKFKKENPNIPIDNLQLKNEKVQDQSNNYPLYGEKLVERVLQIIDEGCAHQGITEILKTIEKEKYEFFSKEAIPIVCDEAVKIHVTNCEDCKEVQEIKKLLVKEPDKPRLTVPENMMARVLSYGDRHHQGYHQINRRLKSWTYCED